MQVAKTILEQLGGAGRLQVMTGAYNFVAYPNGVSFKFKNRKVNYVKITLNGKDLYDIEFLKLTVNSQKKVAEFEDIYFDQLIDIFEDTTGMYLRLFAKGGRLKKDENIEMIFGQLKQIHHHEKELRSIIKKDKSIEPWVIAKLQRATTDLADVTHYEDNKTTKYAKGGGVDTIKFTDLVGKTFEIEYGSTGRKTKWEKEELLDYLKSVVYHNLFDSGFYYSEFIDNQKEYNQKFKETLNIMFEDVDKVLNDYFVFETTPYSTKEEILVFKNKKSTNREFIDNWFKTNKNISNELRSEYKIYRENYAGITPYAKGGEVDTTDLITNMKNGLVVKFSFDYVFGEKGTKYLFFKNGKFYYLKILYKNGKKYSEDKEIVSEQDIIEFYYLHYDSISGEFYNNKMANGGAVSDEINELIYEAMYPLDVTSQAWGALKMAYYDVDTIEEKLEYIEEARFHTNIDDPLYYKLLELEREIERIQSNEEEQDEYAKGGGVGKYKKVMIGDNSVLQNPGITLYNKDSIYLKIINNGPYSYYGGNIYRFEKNGINIYIIPQRKRDGSGKYSSVFWYTVEGKNEGNLKNIDWGDSNAYNEFKQYEKNKDWESIAKMFDYIVDSEIIVKNDKFEKWYKNYLKNPEIEKLPLSQKTRLKLAPIYFMYYYAKGGGVDKSIRFDKQGLMSKLKEKLEIANRAIGKWGESYQKQKDKVEEAIKSKKVTTDIFNIQGDVPKDNYTIFQNGNAYLLATELAKVIKKYKKYETKTTSTGAASGWSGTAKSTVSGFIRGTVNHRSPGGYYGHDRNYLIAIQIGGGVDSSIRKKIEEEVFPLFYILDEYNGNDGGVCLNISNGTNYDTIGLTCSKYSFNESTANYLKEIMNGNEKMAKGGGIEDDITRAKSNAIDKIDFEYYAKKHAGDSWNTMSKQEKAELMSELRDNWFNDSYAKGGNIYNYLVGTDFKYLGELHKVKKVENYPTYTILVTTENRRFRMDILQEQGVKFADKPERKKRQPETAEQKRRKNAFKIKQLQYERKQLLIDMEEEAEPEGGPIANRYGRMLNKIDKQIAQLSGKDSFATGGNIEEEVSYIENRIYNLEQLKQVAGEDEQNYYSRLIQDLEREKSELLNKTSSEVPENKKKFWFFKDGGNLDSEKPIIYIEDFDAIYSGKSYGQWLDLSKFDSGQEVMEALSDIASNWSKRKGEKIETISVTDYENIPRSLYHEFMSSKDYDFIIKAYKVSKQVNIPMWVVGDVMNDYSDSFEHTLEGIKEFIEENYLGFAEDDSDLAYDYIEKNGGIKSLAEEMIKRNFDYEKYGRDVRLGMDSEQEEELGYDKLDDYDLGKELVEQYSDIRELDEKTLKSNFNYKLFGDYLTSFYANYGGHYFRN